MIPTWSESFFITSAQLVTAVRKNSVWLGERGRGSRHRPFVRSRGLAARPQLGFSTVADVGAEAQAVAPGRAEWRPDAQRLLCDVLPVWKTSIGCPPSKMQGVYATCCWNQLYLVQPCFGPLWMNRNRFFWVLMQSPYEAWGTEKDCRLWTAPGRFVLLTPVVVLGTSWHLFSMVFGCLWLQAIRCNHEMHPNLNATHILTTFSGFVEVPMWKWNSGAIWRYWSDQIGIHSSAATNEAARWEPSKPVLCWAWKLVSRFHISWPNFHPHTANVVILRDPGKFMDSSIA